LCCLWLLGDLDNIWESDLTEGEASSGAGSEFGATDNLEEEFEEGKEGDGSDEVVTTGKRKLDSTLPAKTKQQASIEFEKARKKRMNASARMASYRELCKTVAAATVDMTNMEPVQHPLGVVRTDLEVQRNVAAFFNALNSGITENVTKCIENSFSEKIVYKTKLIKYGDFAPFADREVHGRDNVINYWKAFAECYPDGVWHIDTKKMKKGLTSITNDFTFTGTFPHHIFGFLQSVYHF
jgi:hypothetical protein